MHGRVKVKTPAEQAEARKAERIKKIDWYTSTVEDIFKKRDSNEFDEELMRKTEELLRVNPDFLTVWNVRRVTLQRLLLADRAAEDRAKNTCAVTAAEATTESPLAVADASTEAEGNAAASSDPTAELSTDRSSTPNDDSSGGGGGGGAPKAGQDVAPPRVATHDERYLAELALTVACLMVNPKSYGVWHHRAWVMDQLHRPDWNREVELCSRALSKDSRNFHCWDYRRFVAKRALRSAADEVEFTSDKIKASYSNYSAWHNRSRLLPELYPGNAGCGVSQEKLTQELDFAKNAMYTDPVDQSAFFYHRWLLGREGTKLAIRCLYVNRLQQKLIAVLNKPMNLLSGSACIVVDEEYELASWQTTDPRNPSSTVLVCQLTEGQLSERNAHMLTVQVSFKNESSVAMVHLETDMQSACQYSMPSSYNMFFSLAASPDILQQELDSLVELLEINDEADSKWAFLTAVLLLQVLNPVAHRDQVQSYFDSLLRIDPMRSGYYHDLRSRYFMQSVAQQSWLEHNPEQLWQGSCSLDLTSRGLGGLFSLDSWPWLLRLNVSNNNLTSLDGCQVLPFLEELLADDNQIEEIGYEVVALKALTSLSLRNNRIRTVDDKLKHMMSLKRLALAGNPVAAEDCTSAIFTMVTSLESLVLT
ncbi:geranylgeranyl transferase type-2 subunit alpha-like [Sycon ciliatum]|uniref:geranylgeranyl transferase type-2 subunit alpha-like n=1 Tax=Sycon ciliatum TaxID=27933 RepID=UPI0031F6E7FE